MMRIYVGAAFDLRKGRILPILQRSEARPGGTVQVASAGAAFMDLASGVERFLHREIVASRCDGGHAVTVQPVRNVVIYPRDHANNDAAAPVATGPLVAVQIKKQRPGPKPYDHLKFYRVVLQTVGSSGKSNDGKPEILLDDDNLRRIVAAADLNGITPPSRRPNEYGKMPPYSSWEVCLVGNKEACRKAIRNRIKWAMRRL